MTRLFERAVLAYVVVDAFRRALYPPKPVVLAPQTIRIKLDERAISEAVVRYTINRAARGASALQS